MNTFTQNQPLTRDSLSPDPIRQFGHWFQDAEQAELPLFNAMTLATSDLQGKPSARIVLLKEIDHQGFVFYTNYNSRKGRELKENPYVSLVFLWLPLSRQVRIEGSVQKLEARESDRYFESRPRGYQIEAHASYQSQVIKDRSFLEEQFQSLTKKYQGQKVPRPKHWGGFRVIPASIEFWQEGDNRLHDRLLYRRDNHGHWQIERLSP